ncbi:unnamed protein product [Amoebophrya sp. A25]|nr:unnamed protein product [Amoebophrya sp. A25]|eukprot:GSA25T00015775001.1
MGCGASSPAAPADVPQSISGVATRMAHKSLQDRLAEEEAQKEELEWLRQEAREKARKAKAAEEDARNKQMSLASRSERFTQDLLYSLKYGLLTLHDKDDAEQPADHHINIADGEEAAAPDVPVGIAEKQEVETAKTKEACSLSGFMALFKLKCCEPYFSLTDGVGYFDYEECLGRAKSVLRTEEFGGEEGYFAARVQRIRDEEDEEAQLKLKRLIYSATDFVEVCWRIHFEMRLDDEGMRPDIVSDFTKALMDGLVDEKFPDSLAEMDVARHAREICANLFANVYASYAVGVLDMHPQKRLHEEAESDARKEEIEKSPAFGE